MGLILVITSVHLPVLHAGILAIALLFSKKNAWRLLTKTIRSVLFFNLVISLSVVVYAFFKTAIDWPYLLLINLRVITITYLTFYLSKNCNIFAALSFSRQLSFVMVLAYSQILNFRKVYDDLRLAFQSRILSGKPKTYTGYLSASAVNLFLTKSMVQSKSLSLAMRSRGFFDDHAQ